MAAKNRRQKVQELLADFQSLRRGMTFRMSGSAALPRVTPSQWGVLMLIEQNGWSTVKDVAKTLGITSSAATQLVEGLAKSGYLMRETSKEDRRIVTLTLSKKSKKQIIAMKKHVLERFLKIFKALNDREFEQYLALNKKIVRGFVVAAGSGSGDKK